MEDIIKNLDLIIVGALLVGGAVLLMMYSRREDEEWAGHHERGLKRLGERPGYQVEIKPMNRHPARRGEGRTELDAVIETDGVRIEVWNHLSRAEDRTVRFVSYLSTETPLDLVLKGRGLLSAGEHQTGDEALDRELAISGGWTREQLERLGAPELSANLLEAVKDFEMKLEDRELSLTFAGYPRGEGGTLAVVDKFIALIRGLEEAIHGGRGPA